MPSPNPRSSTDEKLALQDGSLDLEALIGSRHDLPTPSPFATPSHDSSARQLSAIRKFLCYPAPGSVKVRSTSWLDGVRGVAALGVYLFHAMGCWANIVAAWHSDEGQDNIFQMPVVRTIFVSGGVAVSMFFAISGYVLTCKSLGWMRAGTTHLVYPALASSLFRRGFRLYLPPMLLTFCEMVSTRFGFLPPLNFSFVAEPTFLAQFVDWLAETNSLVNPVYTYGRALQGFVTHPKYDAVVWTIPLEYFGSIVCYALLFVLASVPSNGLRMAVVAIFAASCMAMGSWNLFCFASGMLLADFNLAQEEDDTIMPPEDHSTLWTVVFAISFYIAGFPTLTYAESKVNPMPGFEILRALLPTSLTMEDHARWWWSLSGVAMLLSISQLPRLKSIFETTFCHYIGKISFCLYLLHEFSLVLFGLTMRDILMRLAGLGPESTGLLYWLVCAVWFVVFTIPLFALAAQAQRWVDVPSVRFAKWLEGECLKIYKSVR